MESAIDAASHRGTDVVAASAMLASAAPSVFSFWTTSASRCSALMTSSVTPVLSVSCRGRAGLAVDDLVRYVAKFAVLLLGLDSQQVERFIGGAARRRHDHALRLFDD